MAPAHRSGLPVLGARLGMPAALPWRRALRPTGAAWVCAAPARALRGLHSAGDSERGPQGEGDPGAGGDAAVP
ncbi:unnamed protein product [Pipistrellus nathusii]|uniref:Uncharacterized protein n=1 Tax=Pipistrellus nathusii TaxID=59473 RepID=A0ABN9ZB83_PIPNA